MLRQRFLRFEELARQLGCFWPVWWAVGRRIPPWKYAYLSLRHWNKVRGFHNTQHGTRTILPEEGAGIEDNSAYFERFRYTLHGFDEVKACLGDGAPLAFITWHHGGGGINYPLVKILPETAFFTRKTFQYGRAFSYSMLGAQSLSLVKMDRMLRQGRPIRYSLDGRPLGKTVRLPMLGVPSDLSTAPIRVMRSVDGTRMVPVTRYFGKGDAIDVFFLRPIPASAFPEGMSDGEMMESLLSILEEDLKERAPEQACWWFLGKRVVAAKRDG